MKPLAFLLLVSLMIGQQSVVAGVVTSPIRKLAEMIFKNFGAETLEKAALEQMIVRAVENHGEECLPFLKKTGYDGLRLLEEAGKKAPQLIKFTEKRGNEAIWVISKPTKTAIFIKHGEPAANALIRHPNIADDLVNRLGADVIEPLNKISQQSAQRLSIMAADGTLDKMGKHTELLGVVRQYGDEAMGFIWKNKGALTVTTALATFLANPEAYIKGGKELVIGSGVNWTLIISLVLGITFLPFIAKSAMKAKAMLVKSKAPS